MKNNVPLWVFFWTYINFHEILVAIGTTILQQMTLIINNVINPETLEKFPIFGFRTHHIISCEQNIYL